MKEYMASIGGIIAVLAIFVLVGKLEHASFALPEGQTALTLDTRRTTALLPQKNTGCYLTNIHNLAISLPSQFIAPGTHDFPFVTEDLEARGCDTRVTSLRVNKNGNVSNYAIQNIRIVDTETGTVLGSANSFTLADATIKLGKNAFVIPQGTIKHISVIADIGLIAKKGQRLTMAIHDGAGTIVYNNKTDGLSLMTNSGKYFGNVAASCWDNRLRHKAKTQI